MQLLQTVLLADTYIDFRAVQDLEGNTNNNKMVGGLAAGRRTHFGATVTKSDTTDVPCKENDFIKFPQPLSISRTADEVCAMR